MSAGVRPERPSLAELVGERPPLEALIEEGGITPGHSKFTAEQLAARADRSVAQSEDEEAAEPSYGAKVAGGLSSFIRGTPVEAAAVGLRALVRPDENYREAYQSIRSGQDVAPAPVRLLNQTAGTVVQALAMPGSTPVRQGAMYGALTGAANADPDKDRHERERDAALLGTVGAIAPKVPGLLGRVGRDVGKGVSTTLATTRDAFLLPVSHSAQVRTAGRLAGLVNEATKAGTKVADDVQVPARVLPFRAPPAPPTPAAVPPDAKTQLAALLQKNLDEGMEAAESVKGYPIANDPPTNTVLMRQIEQALLRAKGSAGAARATPRKGITTPPRTVADVLRGGRQ